MTLSNGKDNITLDETTSSLLSEQYLIADSEQEFTGRNFGKGKIEAEFRSQKT